MRVGGRIGRGLATSVALLLGPAVAWGVATNVQISSPAGEPVETGYVVLDDEGNTVAEGTTDVRGEDELDLRPGRYLFRSGDGERRVEVREGRPARVALTRSPVGLADWGFDLGWQYGYFDHDGTLESDLGLGNPSGSDGLQLNGTASSWLGRVRFPVELVHGQPFVEVGGGIPLSDAEDTGGTLESGVERSFAQLRYEGGVSVGAGFEWVTEPVVRDRGLRFRPQLGVKYGWWDLKVVNENPFGGESNDDEFTTLDGFVGFDVGLPLCACEQVELDFVLGGRLGFPLGDDEEDVTTMGGLGQPVPGEIDFDESWGIHTGLEVRWDPDFAF